MTPSPWALVVLLALAFFLVPPLNSGLSGYQMAVTPDELQGRVSSAMQSLSMGLMPLAPLIAGVLLEHVGVVPTLWSFVALIALAAAITTLNPALRAIPMLSALAEPEAEATVVAG